MIREEVIKITYLLLLIILVISIIWAFHIAPKQMEFFDKCEEKCSEKELNYKTEMFSYPIDNLNAECFCVNKTKVEIDIENE